MAGIRSPDAPTRNNPIKAFIKIPLEGPIDSETAPKIKAPIGPAPIARVTIPRALPLSSSFDTNNTIVDCIVPKPDVPIPSIRSKGRDTRYHLDIANMSKATRDNRDQYKKNLP